MNTPVADANAINELLARYGVKFGIYKNGTFKEQLFPFDAIPRVISAEDFSAMERGLVQVHSPVSGICKSYVHTGDELQKGDLLCEISDPLEGDVISRILSPVNGTVFFRYNRPLEFEKSVLYKIITL